MIRTWRHQLCLFIARAQLHGGGSELSLALASASASEMNWRDGAAFLLAHKFNTAISEEEGKVVLDTGHLRFDVPIFFLSGRTDHVVDAPLTFDYLQRIAAPQKSFVWFEDSGHYPHSRSRRSSMHG
jgi:pimeloyl-ACP methyl ester carboxylesterase